MRRPTVVVVDPDEGVREGLRALISTLGAEVAVFASADGFLTSLDPSAPPTCLITELDLPGMSGLDLLAHLRREGPRVPVIMLATCASVPTAVRCMHLGADHFMEKPVAGLDLLRRLRTILPASPTAAPVRGAGVHPDPTEQTRPTMNARKTILMIDDDADFHETIGTLLESEGYAVAHAMSGREGLRMLREQPPDAIIVDIMMESSTEGYGVTFAIKHQPEYADCADIPLLMVSSIEESPDERFPRAEETDLIRPDRYLTKPVDVTRLLEILRSAVQHA